MPYILLVEDDPAVAELLIMNLKYANFNYIWANDVTMAITELRKEIPLLILLDWMLPDISGIQFIQILKDDIRSKNIPIIMLTARESEHDKIHGLNTGADDYIVKPFSNKELIARINAVLRRSSPEMNNHEFIIGNLKIIPASLSICYKNKKIILPTLVFKLLLYLVNHPDKIYSRDVLLNKIWGYDSFIEERTVDVYIKRLRKYLLHLDLDDIIVTVRGFGYKFDSSKLE